MQLIISCIFLCGIQGRPGLNMCTQDVIQCPDGTFVGRTGPNCEFKCKNGPQAISIPVPSCPLIQPKLGGTCNFEGICYYGEETCCGQTFNSMGCVCSEAQAACFYTENCLGVSAKCGSTTTTTKKPLVCTEDAKQCVDGTFVGRDPNNNCEFKPCPSKPICGGFLNCEAYNDGCNNCRCGLIGDACTKKGCPLPKLIPKPKCIKCKEGYELDEYGVCTNIPSCGGIEYCEDYKKDICNSCGCPDPINKPDVSYCTQQECMKLLQTECVNCIDGYILNDITKQCEKDNGKIECKSRKDCDSYNGYQCRSDPICLGNNEIPSLSCNRQKVCLNISGQCMFNGNCETDHKCVMINSKTGFCVKYQ